MLNYVMAVGSIVVSAHNPTPTSCGVDEMRKQVKENFEQNLTMEMYDSEDTTTARHIGTATASNLRVGESWIERGGDFYISAIQNMKFEFIGGPTQNEEHMILYPADLKTCKVDLSGESGLQTMVSAVK